MNTTTSNSTDALYGVGHWLLDQQRFEDAKHVFRTMLLVAPSDDRGWLGLGASHEGVWELEAAAHLYSLARQACATSVRLAVALGRILRRLDRDASDAYAAAADLAADLDDGELAAMVDAEARES